jgi:predicted dehydrogenase
MSTERKVKIGMIGAGGWPNVMHLPALAACPYADLVAAFDVVPQLTQAAAQKYNIPHTFADYQELLDSGVCEAVIVATPNDTHYQVVMEALDHGLHVMCEKPLAINYAQASAMAKKAEEKGLITCVPFTYRYMPSTRYLKHLIDSNYLGRLYHVQMRYYGGFAREPGQYQWRWDVKRAGSGALGDVGSHFLHLAEWFCGPVEAVCAQLSAFLDRGATDPDGQSYERADDSAMVMLRFQNGAQGLVHATVVAYEKTYANRYNFDQIHEWDFHGSDGTLRQVIDWDYRQAITGDRVGDGPKRELQVPDEYWGDARREPVIDTWEDVFRKQGHLVCEFVRAVASGQPMVPSFADGARTQLLLDAAVESAKTGCWVDTTPKSS